MATKNNQSETTVTRISAADSRTTHTKKPNATVKKSKEGNDTKKRTHRNPLKAVGGYFVGAWEELRQVRWPNRKATWSLVGALLVFTTFFVVLILLLDALFKYVFQLILG